MMLKEFIIPDDEHNANKTLLFGSRHKIVKAQSTDWTAKIKGSF
jgi:hypothetical protein